MTDFHLTITSHEDFKVIRDDKLYGGTKERLINNKVFCNYMKDEIKNKHTLIYTGNYGYGLVVAALFAKKIGKKCICIMNMSYMSGTKIKKDDLIKSSVYIKIKELKAQLILKNSWRSTIQYAQSVNTFDTYWASIFCDIICSCRNNNHFRI